MKFCRYFSLTWPQVELEHPPHLHHPASYSDWIFYSGWKIFNYILSGVSDNEKVGELASLAWSTPFFGSEPYLPVSFSTVQLNSSYIKDWKDRSFSNYWGRLSSTRQAKNYLPINEKFTKFFLSLIKRKIKRFTDVLTGHCWLIKHLFTVQLTASTKNPQKTL